MHDDEVSGPSDYPPGPPSSDEEIEAEILRLEKCFEGGLSINGAQVYAMVKKALKEIAKEDGNPEAIIEIQAQMFEELQNFLCAQNLPAEEMGDTLEEVKAFIEIYAIYRQANNYQPHILLTGGSALLDIIPVFGHFKRYGEASVGYACDGRALTRGQRWGLAKEATVDAGIDVALAAASGGLLTVGKKGVQMGRWAYKLKKVDQALDVAEVAVDGSKFAKTVARVNKTAEEIDTLRDLYGKQRMVMGGANAIWQNLCPNPDEPQPSVDLMSLARAQEAMLNSLSKAT